jgi:hypothetical protein
MKRITSVILLAAIAAWGCSKIENEKLNLKESLDRNIAELNQALDEISGSQGYQMLSGSTSSLKSEIEYRDSITLDLVSGKYVFSPYPKRYLDFFIPFRLFRKTAGSDSLIVTMPNKMAFRPYCLHNFSAPDTLLEKDFTIKAYDYHYYYSWYYRHDYKLAADFELDSEPIGSLDVVSLRNSETGKTYSSEYTFEEGYAINVAFQSGDTTESSFALVDEDDKILMKETRLWISNDTQKREKQYILTIGNIDIKRSTGIDSIQVYLNGELQENAAAVITDTDDSDGSVCHHRDILLTFDDGTTAKLSELIDPARDVLRILVDSLHSMNFAKNVVDYIAISIYYHSNH